MVKNSVKETSHNPHSTSSPRPSPGLSTRPNKKGFRFLFVGPQELYCRHGNATCSSFRVCVPAYVWGLENAFDHIPALLQQVSHLLWQYMSPFAFCKLYAWGVAKCRMVSCAQYVACPWWGHGPAEGHIQNNWFLRAFSKTFSVVESWWIWEIWKS